MFQVKESTVNNLVTKIQPILDKVDAPKRSAFNKHLVDYLLYFQTKTLKNYTTWQKLLLAKIKPQLEITMEEYYVLFMMDYLVLTESLYTHIVDILCFALIHSGKELKDVRKGNEVIVTTFNQVNKLPLGVKLDFLTRNRLSQISKVGKPRLRNAAGHLSYTIGSDDKLYLSDTGEKIDPVLEHDAIREISLGTFLALLSYYHKYADLFKQFSEKGVVDNG